MNLQNFEEIKELNNIDDLNDDIDTILEKTKDIVNRAKRVVSTYNRLDFNHKSQFNPYQNYYLFTNFNDYFCTSYQQREVNLLILPQKFSDVCRNTNDGENKMLEYSPQKVMEWYKNKGLNVFEDTFDVYLEKEIGFLDVEEPEDIDCDQWDKALILISLNNEKDIENVIRDVFDSSVKATPSLN